MVLSKFHIFSLRRERKRINMTLNDFFSAVASIAGLLFVVTSMLAMSLSLSVQQMTQPLKNVRLVILALLACFQL
jgi:predicted Na+-dependent transporter